MNFGRWNFMNEVWMSLHEWNKIKQNKQKQTNSWPLWQCVKIGLSYFLGQDLAPKKNVSSNIEQLVIFQSVLGGSIDLMN